MWQKVALLFALFAGVTLAQNPNPCSQVRNTASPGQVLSAINAGNTPPCQWISAGGGGSGSVTSVAVANGLTASPNPIVTTGTISGINAVADGATIGVAAFTAADFNSSVGVISLDYTNGQKASATLPGFLSSADWSTFNGKQAGGVAITALTGDVTATGPGSVAATIANDAITTVKILNANVTAAKMVNAGVFTGDVTTTFPAITVAKVNGIAYSATGAAHSVPVITTANTTATYKAVPDCTDTGGNHLNFTQSTDAFSCGTSGSSGGITIGTTTITSGTTTRVLFDNAGVVGEYTISGSGNVCMTTSCSMTTPILGTPTSGTATNITGLPCATGILTNYGCMLETHTYSASAAATFTTCIQSGFDDYLIEFINVVPATTAQNFFMRMSTDGGMTYDSGSNYKFLGVYNGFSDTTTVISSAGTTSITIDQSQSTQTSWSLNGTLTMQAPGSAIFKATHSHVSSPVSTGNLYWWQNDGIYASTTAVNAFEFLYASGNIASGTIRCYGVAKT